MTKPAAYTRWRTGDVMVDDSTIARGIRDVARAVFGVDMEEDAMSPEVETELRCAVEFMTDQIHHVMVDHADNSPEFQREWLESFLREHLARYFGNVWDAARAPARKVVGERMKPSEILERALALVLKHEWCGGGVEEGASCPECGADGVSRNRTHDPRCEWGAVVAAAKELG